MALSESSPQTLAIDLWMFFFLIRDLGFESFDLVLVALDLRQDLLLHLQRRQGDLVRFVNVGSIQPGNPCATAQFGKV